MFELLNFSYEVRALVASAIVGITCGVLGCFVVLKRMALIGDAISHAVLPGVVLGFVLFGYNTLAIFIGAVVSGLLTSVIITWIQRNSITRDDSSIGIVFTVMFAIGIIGISWLTKSEGVHLDMKDFLFGNVLGVSDSDLLLTFSIGVYVILCIVLFFKYFFITTFDPLIALTMGISVAIVHYFTMFLLSIVIVASLQSVGVILVVAMLIIPSSAAYLLTHKLKNMLFISAGIGLFSTCVGYYVSVFFEITPGPCMTLVAGSFFCLSFLLSPSRGYLILLLLKYKRRYIADQEDILKLIDKCSKEGVSLTLNVLSRLVDSVSTLMLHIHIYHLRIRHFIYSNEGAFSLTLAGQHEADTLVRAHRLWESFLVHKMNVPLVHIHQSAEEMEHVLPREFIDRLDKDLGFPSIDPHGSPIPVLKKKVTRLSDFEVGQIGMIAFDQTVAVKDLWHLGIFPNSEFVAVEISKEFVIILINNKKFTINKALADKIKVK